MGEACWSHVAGTSPDSRCAACKPTIESIKIGEDERSEYADMAQLSRRVNETCVQEL